MAKDGRTEKATPQRKKKAREEGNVAKSKELSIFFNIASFSILLLWFGDKITSAIVNLQQHAIEMTKMQVKLSSYYVSLTEDSLKIFIPIALVILIFMLGNHFIQIGFLVAWKVMKIDLNKMNPVKYFENMKSRKTIVDIFKSLFVVTILGYVCYIVFKNDMKEIAGSVLLPWNQSIIVLWGILKDILLKVLVVLFIIGMSDFIYQKWEYAENLKMKRHEVKQDRKDYDGSPEVKRAQQKKMIEILKKQVRVKMKDSQAVVKNPTHYAVAIRWKESEGNPRLIVKGIDHLALYIIEVAEELNIPVIENQEFAREMYQRVVENEEIPSDMWKVLKEILLKLIVLKKLKREDLK